jgi:hypothetical protein
VADNIPSPYTAGMSRVSTTGGSGYVLVNGTGTILQWTAPNDGNLHSFLVNFRCIVTSPETGGHVGFTFGSTGNGINLNSGGEGSGDHENESGNTWVAFPGEAITVLQLTALTGGAATVYCEIWA